MEDNKLNLVLAELKNICNKIEKNSEEVENRFEKLDSKLTNFEKENNAAHQKFFESIDFINKKIDKLDSNNQIAHNQILENIERIDQNIDRIDRRITSLKSENAEDHKKLEKHLNSINSSFIRYETDGIDKLRILFDSDADRKHHQDIFGREFKYLHDMVAKNSFRISNLEQHINN